MARRLSIDEIEEFLAAHPDWSTDGAMIRRTCVFSDFNESTGFVVRVAMASELADHHPDIDIRWNTVTITLSTHSEGAITDEDTGLAARIDSMFG